MLRCRLQRLTNPRLSFLVEEELVGEYASLLVEQVRAPGGAGRPGQLEVDELHAQLEVPSLPVPASGVRQCLRQHLGIDAGAVAGM